MLDGMDGFLDFLSSADFFGGGGIFDSLASGYGQESAVAFEDILRGYAPEGRGFTATINEVTDIWLDYQIWRDFGNSGTYQQFEQAFESGGQKAISHVREMVQSHGFMLQQLRAHKDKSKSIAALLSEYEALGTTLPSQDLAQKVYQSLASLFHPDRNPNSAQATELMTKLNVARDTLNNTSKRTAYEEALRNNPKAVEKWFSEIHSSKWEETVSAIRRKGQKALSYSEPSIEMPKTGFSKWFAELPPAGKGGVIFGTVAAVGLGAFALATIADRKQKKSPKTNSNNPSVWQESVTQRDKAPAAHLAI